MDKYGLTDRPKEELTAIIEKLMGQLKYEERIEFLAQWISPQAALDEAGEGDGVRFLEKVRAFCDKCADGEYYHGYDEDYYGDEDYYSSYNNYDSQYKKYKNNKYYDEDEDDYGDFNAMSKEWADQFVSFFKLAIIYSKNRDYATAFTAFAALTDCIYRAASDEEIFGTNNPTYYIKTDWNELFAEYFMSMKNMLPDAGQRADSAIEIWTRFPEYCGDLVMNAFDEIACAEQAIRSRIAGLTDEWFAQHSLYELLTRFYVRFGLEFDEVETAKSMVRYNPIFKSELVRGYMNRSMWDEAILTIGEALKVVPFEPIILALKEKLTVCYEKLNMFGEAYETAVEMFAADYSHGLYVKARGYAVKLDKLESFIDSMETKVLSSNRIDTVDVLLRILSYEGDAAKLADAALRSEGYSRHGYLKYAAKSLIYRAVGPKKTKLPDLDEYIASIKDSEIEGICDMVRSSHDRENKWYLLTDAAGLLKEMVEFHIDAGQRSRYAVAAYYCAVIRDIYSYLDEKETFDAYYENIMAENSRKRALKEEMAIKVGK